MKTYSLLSPAAVLKVSGKEASIMLKDGSKAALGWDGIKWARSYISYNRQGVAPDSAGKVLSAGDIIWVYEKTEVPEGKAGKKEEPRKVLMLAQLPKINSALISLRPDDGQIVAVVGGYSYDASKFNRATQAHRQPGSNFKPFIYSSALRHGFTLATIVNDSPLVARRRRQDLVAQELPEHLRGTYPPARGAGAFQERGVSPTAALCGTQQGRGACREVRLQGY